VKQDEQKYWVFDWLDRHRASTLDSVKLLLLNPVAVQELRQGAAAAIKQFGRKTHSKNESVLVGRGIDLSGQLDCFAPDWRRQQAHRLFNKVWHYFDKIVIEDAVAHELAHHAAEKELPKWLVSHLEVLLYLREIGAEPLLDFKLKPPPCQVHLSQHVKEASLSAILDAEDEVARSVAQRAEIVLKKRAKVVSYQVNFDEFEHTQWGELPLAEIGELKKDEIGVLAVKQIFKEFVAFLASDVRAARMYNLPLGTAIPFHQRLLRTANPPTVADVVMNLQLPVIEGIAPDVLLRIRQDEHECFERFRTQLRVAIQERLQAKDTKEPAKIANEIKQDIIQPELNAIRDRLSAAEKTVVKKSAVGIFMGALATTCGLLAVVVPAVALVGGLAATLGLAGNAATKYLDEKNDISLKNMYFAWRAEKHL